MRKIPVKEAGRRNCRGRWSGRLLRVGLYLLPLTLSACANQRSQTTRPTDDPLLGGGAPARSSPAPTTRPFTPGSPTSSLPPIPVPNGTSSTAALASGAPRTLNPDRELRIGAPQALASTGGNGGWLQATPTNGASGGAILRQPEAVNESAPRQEPSVPPAPGPSANPAPPQASFEQVKAQLESRGVTWQRLENVSETGEWKFSCSIPSRQNPNIRRKYEATAATELAAMQAVLEQIQREN